MRNKIGVVIATYNGEKYVLEQLKSIFNQTVLPDTIIVSDGGSKDNTIKICKDFLEKHTIRYVILTSDKELGVKDNFEKGLTNCNSKYIFFADQDDYWLPNKIENAIKVLESEKAVMVFSNAFIVDENLNKSRKDLWKSIGFKTSKELTIYKKADLSLQKELLMHNIVTGMCMAIDSKIKDYVLPFSNNSIHDVWIANVANCIGIVVAINSKDVLYRQHSNNVIGTKNTIKKSFKKRHQYLENIKKRMLFIDELLLKIDISPEMLKNYNNYKDHLTRRISYIEKKERVLFILLLIRSYIKYEYKWFQIVIKDIIARFYYKRGE